MTKYLRILFLVVLVSFFQPVIAQNKQQFLVQLGSIDSIQSKVLNETREIYIQLPASFQEGSKRKYPTAYILDGELHLPMLASVHEAYYGGFMPEMILIGIANNKNRVRDLTPSKVNELYGMPFKGASGGANNFAEFLQKELIPYIESQYPVTSFRTLIGHSYGGLFTIHTLLNQPDLFANYLAIDPSLDWDNQVLLKQAEKIVAAKDYQGKSLFMSLSGQLHMQNTAITIDNVMEDNSEFTLFARSNIQFSELAKKANGLAVEWKFYPRDLHGTIPLPSTMDGLISLFSWFQMERINKFNAPDTPKDELHEIVRYRANKLEKRFGYSVAPYPEDLFNALGYMSLDGGDTNKAKMFFEFAIEFYPTSANAYDSIADYYIAMEDQDNALKYVTKAYELSGSDYHKQKMEKLK